MSEHPWGQNNTTNLQMVPLDNIRVSLSSHANQIVPQENLPHLERPSQMRLVGNETDARSAIRSSERRSREAQMVMPNSEIMDLGIDQINTDTVEK